MPDTTTVASQILYGVRLMPGIRFSLGSIGRIMPLMARNLASVIISSFREGVFQLGEEQDGHYDHDVEPRRLRGHNGSNTVGDECNNDGGYSEHMVL